MLAAGLDRAGVSRRGDRTVWTVVARVRSFVEGGGGPAAFGSELGTLVDEAEASGDVALLRAYLTQLATEIGSPTGRPASAQAIKATMDLGDRMVRMEEGVGISPIEVLVAELLFAILGKLGRPQALARWRRQ